MLYINSLNYNFLFKLMIGFEFFLPLDPDPGNKTDKNFEKITLKN